MASPRGDRRPSDRKSFFHSLFFDREPFEMWVIPPQWTRGLFVARGYASMAGPFPHEMEGVVNFQGSFKISGRADVVAGQSCRQVCHCADYGLPVADTDPRCDTEEWVCGTCFPSTWTECGRKWVIP